ncbi:unnamed protein product [Paramecium octaurelia]|uniref:Uncharacterized protein n=1 Tax=Paramecium octaurelia TaxID=43137 RepID=A0A8S1YLW1_PAROT|nr:unnamed protein product [Paramecium octaurelia]
MNNIEDFDFYTQYKEDVKNVSVGQRFLLDRCLMEGQIKLYRIVRVEILITLSSTKKPFKICQIKLFKTTKYLFPLAYIGNFQYVPINCKLINLEELQTQLIDHYQQQQQPIDEVQLILNSCR